VLATASEVLAVEGLSVLDQVARGLIKEHRRAIFVNEARDLHLN
jgi:hypothetical protein